MWVIIGLTSPHADWARLGDAYRVNARFVLRGAQDVIVLPASAVFRHDDVDAVFRIEGRRVARVPVQIGLRGGGLVEIRGGLAVGDRVVVHPDRSLEHGGRVRLR